MSLPTFSRSVGLVLSILLVGKLALHLLTAAKYGIHRDEYLYLEMGRHLAWGYKEMPPLLAPFAALSRAMGGSLLVLRLWPAVFGALTVLVVGLLVRELRGGWWATLAAGLATASAPVYLVMHHLFQPNFLEVFFWTLYGYLLVRFRHRPTPSRLVAVGAAVGLGLLAKYGTVFYLLALLPAALLDATLRPWLFSRWAALATAVAAGVFLPNLLWQATHNWPVLGHMAALQHNQLGNVAPADFLIDQLAMTLPGALLWVTALGFTLTRAGRPYQFLSLTFIFLILLLLITRGKNYYTAGIYPPLLALGAVALERALAADHWRGRSMRAAVLLAMPAAIWQIFPALVPIWPLPRLAAYVATLAQKPHLQGLVRWEDGRLHSLPQDLADMQGWDEYAPLAARAWARLTPAERRSTLLIGDNYGPAGACNWHGARYALPSCYSTNGSFSLWWPEPLPDPAAVVYLTEETEIPDVAAGFGRADLVGRIQNPYARCRGGQVWLLRAPKPGVGNFIRKRVAITKAGFDG